jgi:MFS transporter, DHA1 family, multidrug resistance protein
LPKSVAAGPMTTTGATDASRRLSITLYAIITFLFWAALYLYVPTLPTYAQSKTSSLALVGVALSMYGLWQAILRLPVGIASDWAGRRKPFIVGGLALAGLGACLMALAGNIDGVIVGRAVTGLAAATWVPLVVVFSSLFPARDAVRASSLLTLVSSLARAAASSVTGSLNLAGGYHLAFFLAAGLAGLAIVVTLTTREERLPPRTQSAARIGRLIARRDVLLPAVLNAISQYASYATTYGFLPILAKRLGASDIALSALVTLNLLLYSAGNLLATTIVNRIGTRPLVYLSFATFSAGVVVAAIGRSLASVFASQVLIGVGLGIAYPVLMGMSIEHVDDAERATAMGLHQSVYAIGMFAGPWLSGILAEAVGIRAMFGATAFACLALGVIGTRWLGGTPSRSGKEG